MTAIRGFHKLSDVLDFEESNFESALDFLDDYKIDSEKIVKGVEKSLQPTLKEIHKELKRSALQSKVTSEHKHIKHGDNFDKKVLTALATISHKLPSSHPVRRKIERQILQGGDDELGIFPLLAAAIPLVAGAVGKMISKGGGGKKKGKSEPEPTPAEDNPLLIEILRQVETGIKPKEVSNIVKELLRTVPPPVVRGVTEALVAFKQKGADVDKTIKSIVNNVSKEFSPQIDASLKLLKTSALQRQATSEHAGKVKIDKNWANTLSNQKKILKRLDVLENNLTRSKIRAGIMAGAFGVPEKLM